MMKVLSPKRALVASACIAILLLAGFFWVRSSHASSTSIPTAEVRRGEFVDYLQIRGEIKARNSKTLTAPSGAGDLQILKLVRTGTEVKQDDVVVQFDATTLQRTLEQKQTDLKSAEAEIRQQQAQGHMTEEQNLTDSLTAKFNVESATLDATKQEILSEIDGEKTKLALANSQQKLRESETKLQSGKLGSAADVEMKKKKRDKARFDVQMAERQIASMTLRAPSDGMVTLMPNYRAVMWGANPPDFKAGDRAWPGAAVAEIPDLSSIRFEARIDEADRGKLKLHQPVVIRVDAVPDTEFTARVHDISTLAKLDFSNWPPAKNFTLDIQIDRTDPRIRPGMSANSRIAVDSIPSSIMVPSQAIFQHNGRSVAWVRTGTSFEERAVEVGRRSGDSVRIISGLKPGERVALKDLGEGNPAR